MDTFEYLRFFHDIGRDDYELLTSRMRRKSFRKGELITTPGQVQKEVYFIRKGVQMSYADAGDKTHVIAFTYPPNLCAIPESFSSQTPSKYFLTCLTETEADALSFDDLQALFDQSRQLERLFRRMTEAVLAGMINRHIELHSLTMESRYVTFCQRSPHLLQLVPHKYIASYLGIDPTNFSKLFNSVKF
jgi:CRP-like cAMP-binding protein